jgi:hypothetical protein
LLEHFEIAVLTGHARIASEILVLDQFWIKKYGFSTVKTEIY